MEKEQLYEIVKKIARKAASEYDPFERVEVKGPLEGRVVFSDGRSYKFKDGKGFVHRKNLNEAFNLGFKRVRRRSQP